MWGGKWITACNVRVRERKVSMRGRYRLRKKRRELIARGFFQTYVTYSMERSTIIRAMISEICAPLHQKYRVYHKPGRNKFIRRSSRVLRSSQDAPGRSHWPPTYSARAYGRVAVPNVSALLSRSTFKKNSPGSSHSSNATCMQQKKKEKHKADIRQSEKAVIATFVFGCISNQRLRRKIGSGCH
jgi:hypothetical protein